MPTVSLPHSLHDICAWCGQTYAHHTGPRCPPPASGQFAKLGTIYLNKVPPGSLVQLYSSSPDSKTTQCPILVSVQSPYFLEATFCGMRPFSAIIGWNEANKPGPWVYLPQAFSVSGQEMLSRYRLTCGYIASVGNTRRLRLSGSRLPDRDNLVPRGPHIRSGCASGGWPHLLPGQARRYHSRSSDPL